MHIHIIGGGITGLYIAYELSKLIEVTLYEKENYLGGLAASIKMDDFFIEHFYHHIFTGDHALLGLINELGLQSKLMWRKSKMGFYYHDNIVRFSSPLDLFFLKPLSFINRIKFGLVNLKMRLFKNWRELDGIDAVSWIRKNAGEEIYKKVYKPLLKLKWGKFSDRISAAWLCGRSYIRGKSRGSFLSSEILGYLKGGFQILIDQLTKEIENNGGLIKKRAEVTKLTVNDNKVNEITYLENGANNVSNVETVVSTVPSSILSNVLKSPQNDLTTKLKEIKYYGVICAILTIKNKLSEIYWLNVLEKKEFSGVIFHTNWIPPENYGNHQIIYVFKYVNPSSSWFNLTDEKILKIFYDELSKSFQNFTIKDVRWARVFRTKFATPVYEVNYLKVIPNAITPIKGLFLAGMVRNYPVRGLNFSLETGKEVVRAAMKHLEI